jgi:hypothetical protein
LIPAIGLPATYGFDVATNAISLVFLLLMRAAALRGFRRYARSATLNR